MGSRVLLLTLAFISTCDAVLPVSRQCGWGRSNITEEVISIMQNRQPINEDDVVVWRKGEGILHDTRIRRNF